MSGEYYERYWSEEGFSPTGLLSTGVKSLLEEYTAPRGFIADIGCGDGKVVAPWAAASGRQYIGLDVAQRAVDMVRADGFDARLITDPPHLPLEDATVDSAVVFEVLEHVTDPEELLREVHRLLKRSGRVIVTVPNAAYWVRRAELALLGRFNPYGDAESIQRPWRDPHLRFFTRSSLTALLGAAGFRVMVSAGHGHPEFSLRTRLEATGPLRLAIKLRPEFFAPSLHAVAEPN